MPITTSDFAAVPDRASELGCTLPTGLVLLPDNFEQAASGDEFLFRGEAATVAKLLKGVGISASRLDGRSKSEAFIHNKSHDWALPVIYFGVEALKTSPDMISLVISTIQDYLIDLFKGITGIRPIKIEIVVKGSKSNQYRKISYEGDPSGLKDLAGIVKAATKK